ncbi:MarR family transcriptional regulator [Micromonospora inositola]|nr:MarR family transcriptional regulator [Micromonospora inositola]
MTDASPQTAPAHSTFKVLAALAELGDAPAAAVAEHAGLGYSTTTSKLRAWEESGQAERFRTDDGRTLWRLTAAGCTATVTSRADSGQPPATPGTPDPAVEAEADGEQRHDGDDSAATTAADGHPAASGEPAEAEPGLDAPAAPDETATSPAEPGSAEEPASPTPVETAAGGPDAVSTAQAEDRSTKARRVGGSLRGTILDILEAHPDRQYKTGELAKLIDAGNAGNGAAKASPGAVANAATKLVATGKAVQTVERPATFQLAPANGGQ